MVKRLRVMEKKLTNSGPLREPADKHSIYTIEMALNASGIRDTARVLHVSTNTVMTE
jgi:transposase-like protein